MKDCASRPGHVYGVQYICMFDPLLWWQLKADMVKEVAYTRRKQHQASLQYYCALNALQYRKRIAMLEPMLGYTQAQVLNYNWPANWSKCHQYLNSVKWEVSPSLQLMIKLVVSMESVVVKKKKQSKTLLLVRHAMICKSHTPVRHEVSP